MKKLFCLALFLLFFSFTCAATYWVSPTGTASWNNCKNDSPLNGEAACSISTANSNAAAGDTVYLRGGNYTSNGIGVIAPAKSGTSASNRIIFVAYSGEIPIMTNTAPPGSGYGYGFFFEKNSYIKIDGVIFRDCPYWGYFLYSSSYNEITNCTFDSSNYAGAKGTGVLIFPACPPTYDCWNTNNWIHGNTFSKRVYPNDSCGETVDLLRAGDAYGDGTVVENDNYNTIEDNVFSYAGHTLLDTFGNYNVIRNNIFHNEPWITD
jgi:parallel beta-helix repeat protein